MAKEVEYTPLPTPRTLAEIERVTRELDEAEKILLNRSTRWVFFLIILQLIMTIKMVFFGGNFVSVIINSLFISIGIVGVSKKHRKLLTVYLIYSLILYVFSLIGVVVLVLYCDGKHAIWIYVTGFFIILFQAIGMKHIRKMVMILQSVEVQNKNCKMAQCAIEEITLEKESVSPQNYPVYPIPSHQFMAMQMQPGQQVPQYFPYPIPYDQIELTEQSSNQNVFIPIPVVYSEQQQQQV